MLATDGKSIFRALLLAGLFSCLTALVSGQDWEVHPHSIRSSSDGKSLFTLLGEDSTGVVTTNAYDDPRMWGERHSEHNVGAIGTGVAIGDFDGDRWPDVFVVSKVESGRLFRNLGDWKFADVTESAGLLDESGEWKQGAAFVDVDNDGLLDLYICRFAAPNQLFMNQGDGTFVDEAAERGLAVVDASSMASFADYDRDGWLDVYLQTNLLDHLASIEGQRDYLFRNRGDGTFENVTDAAGILDRRTQGHSATWWDQNEDGWLDLYVANDFAPPDILYRNNGDGTFSNVLDKALPHTPFSSMGSDSGDVDGDGRIDFFVADMAGVEYEFSQRGITDSRARVHATENERIDTAIQVHYNALYLNTGSERSIDAAHLAGLAGTDWTWSTRFEDLDQDGKLDLFVTNGMDREHNNLDFVTRKLRAVNVMGRIRVTKAEPVLEQSNLAFRNRGELEFEEVGEAWGLDLKGVSFGAAFGDLDRDGDLDLVLSNYQNGASVYRNDVAKTNSVTLSLRGRASNRFGIGARLEARIGKETQVRELLSARGYLSTSEPIAHFGLGEAERIDALRIVWPSGREQSLETLEAGQHYTIVEALEGEGAERVTENEQPLFSSSATKLNLDLVQEEEELEGTVSQSLLPRRFNRRGPGIAVGDLTGDGFDEILLAGTALESPKLLKYDGQRYGVLDTLEFGGAPPINDGPPLIFDANADGHNDILLTRGGAALPAEEPEYEPRLWLNDGLGGFAPAPPEFLPSLPMSVGAAVSADFNRDGRLDLFLGARLYPGYYPEPANGALLIQAAEGFRDVSNAWLPELVELGLVTSALASDVDGDGWIDLIVALEWGDLRCFLNQSGEGFEDASESLGFDSAGSGLWSSLVSGDFNGDGQMDYALGNLGENTIYRASSEDPMRLYYGDFAGSGERQIVLAYEIQDKIVPVASRGELAGKIPEVRKRFPSNDDYAAASLEEILGTARLEEAEVFVINELNSGVLLSQASGVFQFQKLPRRAQVAPIQGMASLDHDGDGALDLLYVQNDYSAIPAQGRFDSGLGGFLKGDGKGGFSFVDVPKSGWMVPGNAKALALLDLNHDHRADALVSRNNQSTYAFLNTRQDETIDVSLHLKGKKGNPDGIGAKVAVVENGKPLYLCEVRSGGGYESQSSSVLRLSLMPDRAARAKIRIAWPAGGETELDFPSSSGRLSVIE